MSGILKISEAASLGLHSMYLLGSPGAGQLSVGEMATRLNVSANHLAKVLQQLARANLVRSVRGPKGGFTIARSPSEITLLEIYEAIHGQVEPTTCLLGKPVCTGGCMMGNLLHTIDRQIKEHLAKSKLSDFIAEEPTQRPS